MTSSIAQLALFMERNESLAVLSGAGVSTASGIPDYRDKRGDWKHAAPIQYQHFVQDGAARRRYWARSYLGWQRFSRALPNAAHYALADLEALGRVDTVITQNVDRLHSEAGSQCVIDLHGDLGRVRCLDCEKIHTRTDFQRVLKDANLNWHAEVFRYKPDGDAELADNAHQEFAVPGCMTCSGIVKPDVVMFGENVPKHRVLDAMGAIDRADALLVVGSSLMLFSGFRFAREAAAQDKPIAIVTDGLTRADDLATLKIEADCGPVLSTAVSSLAH